MRPVRLPTALSEFGDLKRRVFDLERRLRGLSGSTRPEAFPESIVFNLNGALSVSTSDPYVPLRCSLLQSVACVLGTAGSSSTVVSIKKNGAEITTVTLASSDTFELKNIATKFSIGADKLTVGVTTAGTGADGLVVEAVFV